MKMRNKLKKGYCIFSLILATFAICIGIWYMSGDTAYAASYGATDNAPNASDWVTGKGGVSLTLDSDSGTLSANSSCNYDFSVSTIDFDYADIVYQNHYCASFCTICDWNADGTTESGIDWTCAVFDIFYYVADIYAD